MNTVILDGHAATDPAIKELADGGKVVHFRLAVQRPRRRDGERIADFVTVTAFGTTAEIVADRAHKGARVTLQGRLRVSSWEQDGEKRSRVDVVARNVRIAAKQPVTEESATPDPELETAFATDVDDDIPF